MMHSPATYAAMRANFKARAKEAAKGARMSLLKMPAYAVRGREAFILSRAYRARMAPVYGRV